jgi:hypothetical protein
MRQWVAAALLGFRAVAFGADPVTLEVEAWPVQRDCETCVVLQFRTLEMRIPLTEIERVLSLGAALHLVPPPGRFIDSITIAEALPLEKGKLRVANGEEFFDRLGRKAEGDKTAAALRQAYNIESAVRYTKASKDGLHVYWVRSPERQWNAVYIVDDGSRTTYLLAGPMTQELYEALLANLRVTKIP